MQELAIELKNVEVTMGGKKLLNIPQLAIYQWEKVGIIGGNGQGKTTLLRLLAGELVPDSGVVNRQISFTSFEQVAEGEIEKATNYELLSRLEVPNNDLRHLSGGEETRLKLVTVLADYHEGLLLDEPTTHLDQVGVAFLVDELTYYYGTLIMVSHDRYFLDQTVTKILEVADGHVTTYLGNYSDYVAQKEQEKVSQERAYSNYQQEKGRLTGAMTEKTQKASNLLNVSSKLKARHIKPDRLAGSKEKGSAVKGVQKAAKNIAKKIEQLEVVSRVKLVRELQFQQPEQLVLHNKFPIMADNLTLQKGDKVLLEKASFQFGLGKTIALQGPNGCGKSSLLEHIQQKGYGVTISPKVVFARFEQLSYRLTTEKNLVDYLNRRTAYPEPTVRAVLHNLGFSQLELNKSLTELSGGEKTRLILGELFLQESNVLILDEPTNFIDVTTINALETFIKGYQGTIVLTSHDRYFIEAVANESWVFREKKLVLL